MSHVGSCLRFVEWTQEVQDKDHRKEHIKLKEWPVRSPIMGESSYFMNETEQADVAGMGW